MLVLKRREQEVIVIGEPGQQIMLVEPITITVVEGQTRLGIDAPADIPVHREEVYDQIQEAKQKRNKS